MVKRVIFLCFSLVWLAAAPALAQDAQTRARQLFEQGVTAMDSGNPGPATQYFQQSYDLYPRASTACNMALALERTGRACDAQSWYRQCAALDTQGRFRDHANRQAAALQNQCPQTNPQAQNPFVTGPQPHATEQGRSMRIVEGGGAGPYVTRRDVDHTLLGIGIPSLLVGIGGLVGGGLAAGEANARASQIGAPPSEDPGNPTLLPPGSADATAYNDASTLSSVALGLYVAGGVLSALGAVLIVVDLARPGVFSGGAGRSEGPQLAFAPQTGGGAVGQLTLVF